MSRVAFKQADIVRAVKSARAAGVKVEIVEVITPDGTTIRISGQRDEPRNEWDEVLQDGKN